MGHGIEQRAQSQKQVYVTPDYMPVDLFKNNTITLPNLKKVDPTNIVTNPELLTVALADCRQIMADVYRLVCPPHKNVNAPDVVRMQMERDEQYSKLLLAGVSSDDPETRKEATRRALLVLRNASEQYSDLSLKVTSTGIKR